MTSVAWLGFWHTLYMAASRWLVPRRCSTPLPNRSLREAFAAPAASSLEHRGRLSQSASLASIVWLIRLTLVNGLLLSVEKKVIITYGGKLGKYANEGAQSLHQRSLGCFCMISVVGSISLLFQTPSLIIPSLGSMLMPDNHRERRLVYLRVIWQCSN